MMSVVKRTIRAWQENGVQLNPPASAADFQALRRLLKHEVPDDVRDFYRGANGMAAHECDQHMVSFWSIPTICEEYAKSPEGMIGFADFLIFSWRFLFVVDERGVTVVTENVAPGSPPKGLGSFSEFLERYEGSPDDLGVL
jgi:hypothetical protein